MFKRLAAHMSNNNGSETLATLLLMVTAFTIGAGLITIMTPAFAADSQLAGWIRRATGNMLEGKQII